MKLLDGFSKDLHAHYKCARALFWGDLVIAVVLTLTGEQALGLLFGVLALILANIANVKWVMIKQQTNYENVMDKLGTLQVLLIPEVPKPKTNSAMRKGDKSK